MGISQYVTITICCLRYSDSALLDKFKTIIQDTLLRVTEEEQVLLKRKKISNYVFINCIAASVSQNLTTEFIPKAEETLFSFKQEQGNDGDYACSLCCPCSSLLLDRSCLSLCHHRFCLSSLCCRSQSRPRLLT